MLSTGQIAQGWPVGGRALSPEFALSVSPLLLSDGGGGVLLAWSVVQAGMRVQHLTFAGEVTPGWPAGGVGIPTQYVPGLGQVASDGAGGLYLGWEEYNASVAGNGTSDVFAQHVTAAGTIAPGWPAAGLQLTNLPNSTQQDMRLREDGLGGMCAVWDDYRDYPPQVYAVRVRSDGHLMPGWPAEGMRVSTLGSWELSPDVATDGQGGMFVVWERLTANYKVFAQHLTGTGAVAAGWVAGGIPLAPDPSGDQQYVQIAGDGLGSAIATWDDSRNYTTSLTDIYAQKLVSDGPVPVLLSLVSAEAQPGRALVVWFAADRQVRTVTVYRRSVETAWQMLGTATSDGTGRIAYEDRTVESGGHYAYRLGYADGGTEAFTAETWLDIPGGYRLALDGLRPNPARGDVVVSFALLSAAPARLELIDIAGRRVTSQEVGSLGAGAHVLRLDEGTPVPAGLYWLRLTQGSLTLTAKGVLAH